jgi:hypothetical protein
MMLVTCNNQGELSPLEYGKHAFTAGKGNKWSGPRGKAYAEAISKSPTFVSQVKAAYEVAHAVIFGHPNLTSFTYHLYAIHALPRVLWPGMVAALVADSWSLADTEAAVRRARDYRAAYDVPPEWRKYLPLDDCTLAVATGRLSADDFGRLLRFALEVGSLLLPGPVKP